MKISGYPRRGVADMAAQIGRVSIFLMLLFAPAWSHAAIAVDAAGTNAVGAPSTTLTMSITTGSGTNRILIVEAGTSAGSGGAYDTVSSVVAGSYTFTQLSQEEITQTNYDDLELWYLVNPPASTTLSVKVTFSENHGDAATCVELSGVNQSTPWGAVATKSATSSPEALTITTQYYGSWIISNFQNTNTNGAPTLDGRYTTLNKATNSTDNVYNSMTYFNTAGPAGNYNSYISWSGTISGAAQILAELVESGYPTVTPTITATPTVTSTFTATPTASQSPTSGPTPCSQVMANYVLNGSGNDSSGNGYTLVANGTTSFTGGGCNTGITKAEGPATDTNYYSEGATFLSAFSNLSNFTISFNFYAPSGGFSASSYGPVLLSWTDGAGTWNYLQIGSGSGVALGAMSCSANGDNVTTAGGLFSTGQCYQITYKQSGGTVTVLSNGTQILSFADGGGTDTVTKLYIGRWTNGTGFSFPGYISNLVFTNTTCGGGFPTPTPSPTPTTPALPTVYSGLPTNMQLYGMEYVPFPTVTTSSNTFYPLSMTFSASGATSNSLSNSKWGAPCNTARWRIVFQDLSSTVGAVSGANPQDLTIAVETRIGAYGVNCNTGVYDYNAYSSSGATSLSLPSRPQNNSTSYFWVGVTSTVVPYTERFDAVGDPRFVPYADELDYTGTGAINDGLQGGYNWFFRNFADGSSTYVDGAQDSYYQPFIPSAQFDHYNGQQNIDIPKLFGLIREGVMVSNAIYTAMTGWDSYYAGQGGEIGGDNSNDFGASGNNGVPNWGGPWGSSSNAYNVDEIIGGAGPSPADNGAAYVVTGTSSGNIGWMSLPFVGELWPDGLYASNWEANPANNGGNTTWGNLTNIESTSNGHAGVAYRLDQQDIPSSSNSYYQQTLHRNAANGCATFLNGTNDGSTPFNHNSATETAPLDNDGVQMSTEYNFSLPTTFSVTREWGLTVGGNQPQEWNATNYVNRRTHLDVYSDASYTANNAAGGAGWGFYADANSEASSVNKSAAAIRAIDLNNVLSSQSVSGNPVGGWFIVNGLAPSTQSGINFVAQFAILSCLRTLADAGAPTLSSDMNNVYTGAGAASGQTYRIPPVPLVDILHPTTSDPVAGLTTISIKWDVRDARWDGNQYDENYPCVDANVGPCTSSNLIPNPALEWHDPQALAFNIIYSMPNSVSSTAWYSALTGNIVPAGYSNSFVLGAAGNYMPGADAILPGGTYQTSVYQYTYPWTNVASAEYKVQVECFRLPSESSVTSYPHYAYHQILVDTVP